MSRITWFVAGAGAGVYALVKARRTAEMFTPDGLADRLSALSVGARLFGDEVRAGMGEKEAELRERLRLGGAARAEITSGPDRVAHHPEQLDDHRKGND